MHIPRPYRTTHVMTKLCWCACWSWHGQCLKTHFLTTLLLSDNRWSQCEFYSNKSLLFPRTEDVWYLVVTHEQFEQTLFFQLMQWACYMYLLWWFYRTRQASGYLARLKNFVGSCIYRTYHKHLGVGIYWSIMDNFGTYSTLEMRCKHFFLNFDLVSG